MADTRKTVFKTIPSDSLRPLLKLRDEISPMRGLLEDIIQIVVVLDASAVQAELRWRLGSRSNPNARTGLHEAIESGVVIAVAPVFLKLEIEKYLPLIATDTGVSLDAAVIEWQRVQSLIRFYEPAGHGASFASVDPKDSDYLLTAQELDADFVRTGDCHFVRMGANVIGSEFDGVLRDYARSTSAVVTVKVGSSIVLTFSIEVLAKAIRGVTELMRKLPPAVKLILAVASVIIILHPKSREKLKQWLNTFREHLNANPMLRSLCQDSLNYLAEAITTSQKTSLAIRSKLPVRKKQTALSHARLICLRATGPLSVEEIAQRILANGYYSRSKTLSAYVRRLLRQDHRFVATAEGLWMLRTAGLAAF